MDRQHRRLAAQCEEMRRRMDAAVERVERLENTLCAVAREAGGVSVSHACIRCERSLLLVRNGRMYCPECGYDRTV